MSSLPEINLGYVPGIHLTSSKRKTIIGMSLGGATPKDISSVTRIPLQTVRDTIILDPLRLKGKSLPGRGMHKSCDYVFERNILRLVRTNPKATY
jgi:hypothetical protein